MDQRYGWGTLPHTNPVIEAGLVRSRDESEMQGLLQDAQYGAGIYNTEIEPEHEYEGYCGCATHVYHNAKLNRSGIQEMWSNAVKYPEEHNYNDLFIGGTPSIFSKNPYSSVMSPYGSKLNAASSRTHPKPASHAAFIRETLAHNVKLNRQAQVHVDSLEPKASIWNEPPHAGSDMKYAIPIDAKSADEYQWSNDSGIDTAATSGGNLWEKPSTTLGHHTSLKSFLHMKTPEEKALIAEEKKARAEAKAAEHIAKEAVRCYAIHSEHRNTILAEENGRWPTEAWRQIVEVYQLKAGIKRKVAHLRAHQPLQYLHLLRAGYFEPIPVAWATMDGNPLKFTIEAAAGWRGITPQWRGYEDTAEERLYWVLNHREAPFGQPQQRLKPDFISELNMARARMARAVEPPPQYFSEGDVCYQEHKRDGYSRQVLPLPFHAYDRPQAPADDTMILLDVSGSMDFDPVRPVYDQYLVTGFAPSPQPKNKALAKAIVRRFTDAMIHHDRSYEGYDLVTFSSYAEVIGKISHANFEQKWRSVRIGGGTRVMTGWQKVKEMHFQKHQASATHHPVFGWIAGPETPMLRLLLLLDGEASDMDEFELDLLGLDWAHVTIFLIGVDGCPHHHRHANELQRISEVNHHVAFVDAQGNTPERFVTHELLKRHLGQDITMAEFVQMEDLPPYSTGISLD